MCLYILETIVFETNLWWKKNTMKGFNMKQKRNKEWKNYCYSNTLCFSAFMAMLNTVIFFCLHSDTVSPGDHMVQASLVFIILIFLMIKHDCKKYFLNNVNKTQSLIFSKLYLCFVLCISLYIFILYLWINYSFPVQFNIKHMSLTFSI